MLPHHYIVAQNGNHWKISFHGTDQGPFSSKDDAITVAIREAKLAGVDVEVLVQDVDMKFHSAWKASDAV